MGGKVGLYAEHSNKSTEASAYYLQCQVIWAGLSGSYNHETFIILVQDGNFVPVKA